MLTPEFSIPLVAAVALVGWWLAVRPNSSYRGVASPVSYLIITAAVLMCLLVLTDASAPRGDGLRRASLSAIAP